MFFVQIECSSLEDFRAKLAAMYAEFGCGVDPNQPSLPIDLGSNKKKKKKDVAAEEPKEVVSPEPVTLEIAKSYLQKVVAEKSLIQAQEILAEFGAHKVSELAIEHYDAFVSKCRAVLG